MHISLTIEKDGLVKEMEALRENVKYLELETTPNCC